MTRFDSQIHRARRRLLCQSGLAHLSRALCGATFVAVAIIFLMERYWPTGVTSLVWCAICGGGALVTTAAATWVTRSSLLDAAREIDRRYGLHERVASALSLTIDERETPAGRALLGDAARYVERLTIGERFGLEWGRWALLPALPGLLALLLVLFLPPAIHTQAAAKSNQPIEQEQLQQSSEKLRKQLEERKQEAESKGLEAAEDLFGKLERSVEEIQKEGQTDRKQALIKLHDLAQELEQRRRDVAQSESVKQQLEQLKQIQQGPADRMLEAVKKGDLKQANAELNQLREKLAGGKLDDQARKDLTKQLEQMQQKLQAAADAQQQAAQDLQQKIEQARAADRGEQAEQLQQQLDQLRERMGNGEQLEQLAQQLGKAAESLKHAQNQQAADQLQQVGDQLDALREQLEEGELLEMTLDQLADARQAMNGENAAPGAANQPGQGVPGQRLGQGQGPGRGPGQGKGEGHGWQNDAKVGEAAYDTQVRQKVGKGSALVTGFVDGPNAKGRVQAQIREEWQAVKAEQSNPISDQPLPRNYREHAERYFDALRTGK